MIPRFRQRAAWCLANPVSAIRVIAGRTLGFMPRPPSRQQLWSKLAVLRPLLSCETEELTFGQRVLKKLLIISLKIPDLHYRRVLVKLDAQLASRSMSKVNPSKISRRGTLMMIGTLGPGGAERQLVATAKGLYANGERNVSVACMDLSSKANTFFLPELEAAGIITTIIGSETRDLLDCKTLDIIRKLPNELRDVERYAATLASRRPEIVHLWLDDINVKGGIAAALTGIERIVISQRSLPPINFGLHQPYMREVYRWLVRRPGVKMINNSAAGAREYETWLGLPPGTISVVHNGYAFDEGDLLHYRAAHGDYRRKCGIDPKALVVGGVMRISEEKRPLLWLDIAAQIRQTLPEVKFIIVGDGTMREVMEVRASHSDLVGSVHFTGQLNDAMGAIKDMDLLLLTSRAEGLPNVLVEAQILGVPVVAMPVGGAPEAVDHGKSGWLLAGNDAKSSAEQIIRLLRDDKWRAEAAKHGPKFALARFGMKRAIEETLAAYGETMIAAQGAVHEPS